MEFIKKVLILKQIKEGFSINEKKVGGIARFEQENGVLTLYLSPINYKPQLFGEFFLFVLDGKKKSSIFSLGKCPPCSPFVIEEDLDIVGGVSVGIAYFEKECVLTSFCCSEELSIKVSEFKKYLLKQNFFANKITEEDIKELEYLENVTYDDEVVATENYYDYDSKIEEKLQDIYEMTGEEKCEPLKVSEETEQEDIKENFEEKQTEGKYYLKVKKELDEIFAKFEREEVLERNVPLSKWARINYGENKYYVVGLVFENGEEKYICYGIPAEYSLNPPEELKGFCSFVPKSVFSLKGEGYWIMFQSAETGECVLIDEK